MKLFPRFVTALLVLAMLAAARTTADSIAPLLLTMEGCEAQAGAYVQENAIENGILLGGEGLIPESSVGLIFGQ